jgi:hypothetical protein
MQYPAAVWKPVASHGFRMSEHLGLILHVQVGRGGLQREFTNPLRKKSSTWWAGEAGEVEQYVDADYRAWAQGSGNDFYNSVETAGFPSEPLTDAQVASIAELYRWATTSTTGRTASLSVPENAALAGTAWAAAVGARTPVAQATSARRNATTFSTWPKANQLRRRTTTCPLGSRSPVDRRLLARPTLRRRCLRL